MQPSSTMKEVNTGPVQKESEPVRKQPCLHLPFLSFLHQWRKSCKTECYRRKQNLDNNKAAVEPW